MSVEISISLSPESARFIAQLHTAPEQIQRALCKVIDEQNELTIGEMTIKRLSRRGKTTLGVVTNRLRSSIRASKTTVTSDGVQTSIGTNVAYAGVHEFGFNGNVTVRSHSRHLTEHKRGARKDIVVYTRDGKAQTKSQRTNRKIVGETTVRSHTRRMHMPERSFIRATLHERAPIYTAVIGAAVRNALGF